MLKLHLIGDIIEIMKIRNTYIILIAVYLSFLALGLPDGAFGVAWPEIRTNMNLPLEWAGIMIMLNSAFYVTVSSQLGRLAKKIKLWNISLIGLISMSIGFTIIAISPNFIILLFAVAFTGSGMALVDSSLNSYMAKSFGAREMNWLHCFWGIGAVLSPILITQMILLGNWRLGYFAIAAIQGIIAMLIMASRAKGVWETEERRIRFSKNKEENAELTGAYLTQKRHKFMQILVFYLYCGAEYATGFWITGVLMYSRGLDIGQAGMFPAVYYGFIMLGRMVFGFLANKLSSPAMLRIGFTISLAGIGILLFQSSLAGMALIGFGFAPIFACMMHNNSDRFHPKILTKLIGFEMAAVGAGVATLSALTGQILARISLEALFPIIIILIATAFLINEIIERNVKHVKNSD